MNTYLLVSLMAGTALLPLGAVGIAVKLDGYTAVLIICSVIWVVCIAAGFGVWFYALHATHLLHGGNGWWLFPVIILNVMGGIIMGIELLD